MQREQFGKDLDRLINTTYVVLVVSAVILFIKFGFPILGEFLSYIPLLLMPLIVAIILAAVMEPLVSALERFVSRIWATLLSFIIVLGGFAALITVVAVVAVKQLSSLYVLAMKHSDQIIAITLKSVSNAKLFFLNLKLPPEAQDALEKGLTSGATFLKDLLGSMVKGLGSGLGSLPEALMFIMIAAVATFFLIKDQAIILAFLERVVPAQVMDKATTIIRRIFDTLLGFLKGYAIITTVTAIITVIGLTILGADSAFVMGIFIAVLDIVPVIGSGIIFIPWIIISIISGQPVLGLELFGLWVGVGVVRQLIEPKIVGDNIGLHPLVSLISLYAGLKIAGFIGMVLGPVTVVIFLSMARAGLFDTLVPWIHTDHRTVEQIEDGVLGEGTDE